LTLSLDLNAVSANPTPNAAATKIGGGVVEGLEVSKRSERALRKTSILAMNYHPRIVYRRDDGHIHY